MSTLRKVSSNISPSFEILLKHSSGKSDKRRKVIGGILLVVLILIAVTVGIVVTFFVLKASENKTEKEIESTTISIANDSIYFLSVSENVTEYKGNTDDSIQFPGAFKKRIAHTVSIDALLIREKSGSVTSRRPANIMVLIGGRTGSGELTKSVDVLGSNTCTGIPKYVSKYKIEFSIR